MYASFTGIHSLSVHSSSIYGNVNLCEGKTGKINMTTFSNPNVCIGGSIGGIFGEHTKWALCCQWIRLCVNVDVPRPHVSAGTWSRPAAFRPEQGVSFIQLPPHYLSSPSAPSSLFSHWVWREVTLLRQTVIAASCPYVGFKSSVIHCMQVIQRGCSLFPVIRVWLRVIFLLSSLSKIGCFSAEV